MGWARSVAIGLVAAVLGVGPAASAAEPEPLPEDDRSRFESATVSGLSVAVKRGHERLRAGRDTTYTITVHNRGERPESTTIRVALPPGMSGVAPADGGTLGNGYVEWPVRVAPGAPATLHLTGAYTRQGAAGRDGAPRRVAFTACALEEDGGPPLVCATDIAELDTRGWTLLWWLLAATVVLAAGATALVLRHRRSRRPAR